jgi:N-acetylglutamate synthase-like GNAT family acetyltransferase
MKLIYVNDILGETNIILDSWNQEFKSSFPITEELFKAKIIDSAYTLKKESICLYLEKEYVGSVILKGHDNNLYVSFIHIKNDKRNKGYGELLINEIKKLAEEKKYKKIILGSDPDCIFSGVFMEKNDDVHRFFSNQGFTRDYINYNLIAYETPKRVPVPDDYDIRKAEEKDRLELLDFIKAHFSERWLNEVRENKINQVYVLLHEDKIIGFVNTALSQNHHYPNSLNLYQLFDNLAGIGPLGLAPDFQSRGLGKGFVNYVMRDLFDSGASEVMVDWTGLIDFYKKCGFNEVYKKYIIYSMKVGN